MKDREIITPDDEDDIANRRAAAYEREIDHGDYLRDEQQDRLAEERAMSPGEKWEADYEASRTHIGKTKEEMMTHPQLVKYARQLKGMIGNLQTANAGMSEDKARLDWLIQNHVANFECVENIAGNLDRYHIPATREAIDAEILLKNDKAGNYAFEGDIECGVASQARTTGN
jgi:hypothetical protein